MPYFDGAEFRDYCQREAEDAGNACTDNDSCTYNCRPLASADLTDCLENGAHFDQEGLRGRRCTTALRGECTMLPLDGPQLAGPMTIVFPPDEE